MTAAAPNEDLILGSSFVGSRSSNFRCVSCSREDFSKISIPLMDEYFGIKERGQFHLDCVRSRQTWQRGTEYIETVQVSSVGSPIAAFNVSDMAKRLKPIYESNDVARTCCKFEADWTLSAPFTLQLPSHSECRFSNDELPDWRLLRNSAYRASS